MEFMACKHNLAINRQTRMLANLSKANCYNSTGMTEEERNSIILESAKENLMDMAFFGLSEYQNYTQFLFEHTLNLHFVEDFKQHESTHTSRQPISQDDLNKVARLNYLDIELYQFAKDLFLQRVHEAFIEEDIPVPADLMYELETRAKHADANFNKHQSQDGAKKQNAREGKVISETNNLDKFVVNNKDSARENADSLVDDLRDDSR